MFQSDRDLSKSGKSRGVNDLKLQREARARIRKRNDSATLVQSHWRGVKSRSESRRTVQLAWDSKIRDIERLKEIVASNQQFCLPPQVINSLWREFLFFYCDKDHHDDGDNATRLDLLCKVLLPSLSNHGFISSLEADFISKQRLEKLIVIICLNTNEKKSTTMMPLNVMLQLVTHSSYCTHYLATNDCHLILQALRNRVNTTNREEGIPSASCEILVTILQKVLDNKNIAVDNSKIFLNLFSIPLIAIAVPSLKTRPDFWLQRKNNNLENSIPKDKALWILGNLLDCFCENANDDSTTMMMVSNLSVITRLLQVINVEAFADVPIIWKVTAGTCMTAESLPPLLSKQLSRISTTVLNQIFKFLLQYKSVSVSSTTSASIPPMNPEALTLEEKYGFGSMNKSSSSLQSFSDTLHSVLSLPSKWASKLFKKEVKVPIKATTVDTTMQSFINREGVLAFCKTYSTFFERWDIHSYPISLKLLSNIAYKRMGKDNVSIVKLLWRFINESKLSSTESTYSVVSIMCLCYNHLLFVMEDREMYEEQYPLSHYELEKLIQFLIKLLYPIHQDTKLLVNTATTRLLKALYNKCSKRPFCNVTTWTSVSSHNIKEEEKSSLLLRMPYVIPFEARVELFQNLVAQSFEPLSQARRPRVFKIRRTHVFEDGFAKMKRGVDLRQRIQIVFTNAAGAPEKGIDAGGLFKEFWIDLSSLAFDPSYGLFKSTTDENGLYPNPESSILFGDNHLELFEFLGKILGKALAEGIVVQPRFATFFLSKLVGNVNTLCDLCSLDSELYKNLMFLKNYDGDLSDLSLYFTTGSSSSSSATEVELVPGGSSIPVTNSNRTRYIHLMANYYLNTQIMEQSKAFVRGMHSVLNKSWMSMLNEPELQVLISGTDGKIDIKDLKAHCVYTGGYFFGDKRIIWFWRILESFSSVEASALLRFTTSCQRPPSLGFKVMYPAFTIQKIPIKSDDEKLPSASTCFNILKLPTYSSQKVMKSKLLLAISSKAGFEMS